MAAALKTVDLAAAVAKLEGYELDEHGCIDKHNGVKVLYIHEHTDRRPYRPDENWCDGGPIVGRHIHWLRFDPQELSATTVGNTTTYKYDMENAWEAGARTMDDPQGESHVRERGPTMLVAAMRCYVALKS